MRGDNINISKNKTITEVNMERKFITVTKTVTEQVAANRVRITLTAYGEAKTVS